MSDDNDERERWLEYERVDAATERAWSAAVEAYEELAAQHRASQSALAVMQAAAAAELAGDDPKAAARKALEAMGWPLWQDLAHNYERSNFRGSMRYACEQICNEHYRRLGGPKPNR